MATERRVALVVGNNGQKNEIACEVVKTAYLRDVKRRRFLRALWVAAMSFVILFLGQLLRSEGVLSI